MQGRLELLLKELRSRSVIRALAAYAVIAWMLLQVADVTFDRLPLPDSAMTVLIVLVLAGFPVTLLLAWGYEITARGIVRHEETDGGAPRLAFLPFMLLIAVITAGSGYGLYYLSQNYWEPDRRSIAILPFTNMSGNEETNYFSDGLTEEIRSLIVRLNEFRVVALSTSYQLHETLTDVVTIARRLGAQVIMQGSVRRYNDRVQVTARLIDGGSGAEIWSDTYQREIADIFDIQKDIARQVARELHVVLPVSAKRRLAKLGTRNIEAYDLYLRAIDQLRQPAGQVSLGLSEDLVREAIAIDPDFAKAYATLCQIHLAHYRLDRDASRFQLAQDACNQALQRDSASSDVYLALGGLYSVSGRYDDSIGAYEKALESNRNSPDAHIGLARNYIQLHQDESAEANLRQAIELDVSYWASFNAMGNFLFDKGRYLEAAEFYRIFARRAEDDSRALSNLGAAYYLAGEFSKAAEAWEESLAIKPTRSAYSNTGTMYFYLGEFDLAADRYAQAVALAPTDHRLWGNLADAYYFSAGMHQVADVAYSRAIKFGEDRLAVNAEDVDTISDIAYYYSRVGKERQSRKLDAKAASAAPGNIYVQYNSALIHAYLGDTEQALQALERAVALGYQTDLLSIDPGLRPLRSEARFQRLVSNHDP
ncbi:MAG: hypothetical protein BMS9Abin32_138 [Gammaproteobacteria bacterium]|nr:MAG: hypothetical protein BMS9Abin32_138 [Gammaproteobacteria bacterium]